MAALEGVAERGEPVDAGPATDAKGTIGVKATCRECDVSASECGGLDPSQDRYVGQRWSERKAKHRLVFHVRDRR